MAEESESKSHFGTIIGAVFAVLIVTMLLTMTLVAANKQTYYSAYVSSGDDEREIFGQVTDMRNTLADDEGYEIANTMSTPMLVNDWKDPHRTLLVIADPEKPIDETEADSIFRFVTERGGKVVVAADNTNANRLAAKFGVTYLGDPLLDKFQTWTTFTDEGSSGAENWGQVWALASVREDVNNDNWAGGGFKPPGCTQTQIDNGEVDGCRMPVMFKSPTAMRWESVATDNVEHPDYVPRFVRTLAMASDTACVDRMGSNGCDDPRNPISNLSLVLRIDYPHIEANDLRRLAGEDGSTYGSLDVTGSIVFISDPEPISNRFWDADRASETDVRQTCDTELIACWQRQLSGDSAWKGNELYFAALIYDMMEFDNEQLPYSIRLQFSEFRIVFDESRHVTGALSNPFIETMSTIVLLTSDDFLKWLIVLNLLLLLLVSIMVVPEKENWRHVFDLTRFRERPNKIDPESYQQRMREALMTKVRLFYDLTRDEMALKTPAETQSMIGDPRLVELAYSQQRSYSPEEKRQLLQTIRRWGKK